MGFDQDWEFQIKSWINPLLFHIRMLDVIKGLKGGGLGTLEKTGFNPTFVFRIIVGYNSMGWVSFTNLKVFKGEFNLVKYPGAAPPPSLILSMKIL